MHNSAVERTAGSHSLAAAAHCDRYAEIEWATFRGESGSVLAATACLSCSDTLWPREKEQC
jgi:hypothetical protein